MSRDYVLRQAGRTNGRQPWNLPGLNSILKTDFVPSRRDREAINKLVREIEMENQNMTMVEKINWFRVVILMIQLRNAANRNILFSGERLEDETMSYEEFQERKQKERSQIPHLDKQLSDALRATGGTTAQKRISDDIRTSAEAAQQVYEKFRSGDI